MALSGTLNTNDYDGRFYQVKWTATQSINNNSSTINWTVSALGGGTRWFAERTLKVIIAGKTVVDKVDRVERYDGEIAKGSFTISHAADGSKSFAASIQAAVYTSTINCTGNTTFALDQIPKQAIITHAPNFTDEDALTVTYRNTAGTAVSSLDMAIGWTGADDIKYRSVSKTGTSYTFNFTSDERIKLQDAVTSGTSRIVTIYLRTIISGVTYYSTIKKTLTIANAMPELRPVLTEQDAGVKQALNSSDIMIIGESQIYCVANASANKRASIVSVSITNGARVVNSASATFNEPSSNVFIFEAVDSRGNRVTETVTREAFPYIPLTINASFNNFTASGTASFSVSGNYFNDYFNPSYANTLMVRYNYGVVGEGYTNSNYATVSVVDNHYTANFNITGLDYTKAYQVKVTAMDRFNDVSSADFRFTGQPIFEWSKSDFKFNVPVTFAAGATGVEGGTGGGTITDGTVNGDLTVTGNLRLKGDGNYGNKLYFGDGSYAMVSEDTDDALTIKASKINLNGTVKVNGNDIPTATPDLSKGGTINGNLTVNGGDINLNGTVKINGSDIPTAATTGGISGTWTPKLNTGSSILVNSYTTQQGWYQKIGNVVTVGFFVKAQMASYSGTRIFELNGLPFTPKYSAAGGGMCAGAKAAANYNFQCFVAETDGGITARAQQCNNSVDTTLGTSASGIYYHNGGGEFTVSGTITYIAS